MTERFVPDRRRLLAGAALAGIGLLTPARLVRAATPEPTPAQTEGPFYPLSLPLDRDNDLMTVAGRPERAAGTVAHLFGRVLDPDGRPVPDALVEIWQCNAFGRYHHPNAPATGPLDPNFQGYGQMLTAADGAYRFRALRPVAYPGRTPHIHVAVRAPGARPFVTQMYVAGEPLNARDGIFNAIDPAARPRVLVDLRPADTVEPGALAGTFDIVLGDG